MTVELKIEGMSCEHCAGRVEKALTAVEGVTEARVSLKPGSARVTGDALDVSALIDAVDRAGYTATSA